jgi:ubiquitin carboxyl-terminal hydrolase 8
VISLTHSDGSYKRAINVHNKLGTKGNLANAWSELLKALWREDYTFLSPVTFRVSVSRLSSNVS